MTSLQSLTQHDQCEQPTVGLGPAKWYIIATPNGTLWCETATAKTLRVDLFTLLPPDQGDDAILNRRFTFDASTNSPNTESPRPAEACQLAYPSLDQ
jgi:hypothetical protein